MLDFLLWKFPNGGHVISWVALMCYVGFRGFFLGMKGFLALIGGGMVLVFHEWFFFIGVLYFYHIPSYFLVEYSVIIGISIFALKRFGWTFRIIPFLLSFAFFIPWFVYGFPTSDPLDGTANDNNLLINGIEIASWIWFVLVFGYSDWRDHVNHTKT